jgi:hypothetical protein
LVKFSVEFDEKGVAHPKFEVGGVLLKQNPEVKGDAESQQGEFDTSPTEPSPTPDELFSVEKHIFVNYHGKIYQILCVAEKDFWDAIHRSL